MRSTNSGERRRLPPGVKFFIWPAYCREVEGVRVYLPKVRAEILLFLMSDPGRVYSGKEISDFIYFDRENGGPQHAPNTICIHMMKLQEHCLREGVELQLKSEWSSRGYVFIGARLTDKAREKLDSGAIIAGLLPIVSRFVANTAKPVVKKVAKKPRKKERRIYRYEDTGNWTFPERHERYRQHAQEKSGEKPRPDPE